MMHGTMSLKFSGAHIKFCVPLCVLCYVHSRNQDTLSCIYTGNTLVLGILWQCRQTQRHRHTDCNVIQCCTAVMCCLTWTVSGECSEHQRAGQLDNAASLAQGRANYVQSQA